MKKPPLLEALQNRPLCCDGAMGTQLLERGLPGGVCGMTWNSQQPDKVIEVHSDYLRSGCELIITNSFGGSASALERHGLGDQVRDLNLAAARIACQAAGDAAWVLGDVGPFGDFLEPLGDMTADELRIIFLAQVEALLEGGADAILVETMSDPAEAIVAIEAVRACSSVVPVIVSYAFQKTAGGVMRTMMGTPVEEAVQQALAAGADIVGANCGTDLGLEDYVVLAAQIAAAAGDKLVIIQPNAGSPRPYGDRTVYDASPEEMAKVAGDLLAAGARIVGGCCGTTPRHMAAMAERIRQWSK